MSLLCLRGWYGWSSQPLPVLNSAVLSVTVVMSSSSSTSSSSTSATQAAKKRNKGDFERTLWKGEVKKEKKRWWLITIMNSFLNERPFGKSNRHRCCCCLIHYNCLPLLSEWESAASFIVPDSNVGAKTRETRRSVHNFFILPGTRLRVFSD